MIYREFTISKRTLLTTNTVAEENNGNNYVIEGTHNHDAHRGPTFDRREERS